MHSHDEKKEMSFGLSEVLFEASKLALDDMERFELNEVPNMILVKYLLKDKGSVLKNFLKNMHVKDEDVQKALETRITPYLGGKEANESNVKPKDHRIDLKKFNFKTLGWAAENSSGLYNLIDENCFLLAMLTETDIKSKSPYDKTFVDFLRELNIEPEVAECYFEGKIRKLEVLYSEIESVGRSLIS